MFGKIFWYFIDYLIGQNFGGQNFSADKVFGSKSDFRLFCPPKFCPIRYNDFKDTFINTHTNIPIHEFLMGLNFFNEFGDSRNGDFAKVLKKPFKEIQGNFLILN